MDKALDKFLIGLGCRRREAKYILDGLQCNFYLIFDTAIDEDNPKPSTCDILLCRVGSHPMDYDNHIRVVADATAHRVVRFMIAIGTENLSEATRNFVNTSNSVIRAQ